MLHSSGFCLPSFSYSRFGREGHDLLSEGPVVMRKSTEFRCVAMSEEYSNYLARYIESLALAPMIEERGHLEARHVLGASTYAGISIEAIEPVIDEWREFFVKSDGSVSNEIVVEFGMESGPEPVLNYPGFGYVKSTYINSLSPPMKVITVYFLFRQAIVGSTVRQTLIGILACMRPDGVFDARCTGRFFTPDALNTLRMWRRK